MTEVYADTLRRHRRLTILRALSGLPGYSANESVIEGVLERFRVTSTRDQVRTEFGWLADQGFVSLEDIEGYHIVTITQAGVDIAAGKRVHPDIEKPAPKKR